jgi:sugar/nucleoside kinase (ribokinase family)
MCNPLYDIQAEISDELLAEVGLPKGAMVLIDEAQQREIVSKVYTHIVNTEPGGSGANTMIGIAQLGGSACYTGKIGTDEHGELYTAGLEAKKVRVCTATGAGTTGICAVLITPDAQRTMGTFLGICRELGPEDVQVEMLKECQYLYVTSYLWDTDTQKAAVLKAMRSAREHGVKVALSLSDSFCVNRHKEELTQIVHEHVDLLIGNDAEAMVFTDTQTPRDAIRAMIPYCDLAVVTMSAKGSLLREGDQMIEVPAYPTHPIDTTGAGDMYAAGLLYGITHDVPLEKAGHLASYLAAQVVGHLGPRLPEIDRQAVERLLN